MKETNGMAQFSFKNLQNVMYQFWTPTHLPMTILRSLFCYLKLNLENDVFEPYKETEDGTYSPSGTYSLCQSLHLPLSLAVVQIFHQEQFLNMACGFE